MRNWEAQRSAEKEEAGNGRERERVGRRSVKTIFKLFFNVISLNFLFNGGVYWSHKRVTNRMVKLNFFVQDF